VAEFGEFGGDATAAPHRVFSHSLDQLYDLATDPRTPGTPRLVRPEAGESAMVPADHSGWLHDRERVGPSRPNPREHDPERSVDRTHLRPGRLAPQDGELLAQREVLGDEARPRA
jgi:hypothetical protein